MKNTNILAFCFFSLCFTCLWISACQNDEPSPHPNPVESITTITFTLTPLEGGESVFWSYSDPDGLGGEGPEVVFEPLKPFTLYEGVLSLSDESVNPVEDRTGEIIMESGEHQFFYTFSDALSAFQYMDFDENGLPVGLRTRFYSYGPSEGLLNIKLIHKAEKDVPGVSDGDITNAGGQTDLDITFHIVIEE